MAVALSTVDNPFNPLTQFDEWYQYDVRKGYNSCAYLARVARTSHNLAPIDYLKSIEDAIDEIVKYNVLGIYIKVTENDVPRGG